MKKKAIIIGGGIAGATTALSLRNLGLDVMVIERHTLLEMSSEASNAICNMHPRFDAEFNKYTSFYLEAYLYALNFYDDYPDQFVKSSMKIFPSKNNIAKLKKIADMLGSDICNMENSNIYGAYLRLISSGYLYIKTLSQFILKDFNVLYNQKIIKIKQTMSDIWSVFNESLEEIACADYIIFANSDNAVEFFPHLKPYLQFIRGQSTAIDTEISTDPDILCFPSISIVQDKAGRLNFGSSYQRNNLSTELQESCQSQNIDNLCRHFRPAEDLYKKPLSGYVGIRTAPIDYLPIVGEIKEKKGIYINIGHGSRGVTSAPISANIIANLISGMQENNLLKFLSPTRFLKGKNA